MADSLIKQALGCSDYFYAPESYLANVHLNKSVTNFYQSYPCLSRTLFGAGATLLGAGKVFLFPIIALVAVVAMPIIALVRGIQGKGDAKAWLVAWSFSVLGLAAFACFVTVAAFHMPLIGSCVVLWGGVAASITVHVYRAMKDPLPLPSIEMKLIS